MNSVTVALLAALSLSGCASSTVNPIAQSATSVTQQTASSDSAQPMTSHGMPVTTTVSEAKALVPLARLLTSEELAKHANESLAIAATNDVEFRQCIKFVLALGQELTVRPLVSSVTLGATNVPQPSVDSSCKLCALAAKRKHTATRIAVGLDSSLALSNLQAADIKGRVININRRLNQACAPLVNSDNNIAQQLLQLLGDMK